MLKITEDPKFVKKEIDLESRHGVTVLGYFPYATKTIVHEGKGVNIPRSFFADLESKLKVNNNKVVVICRDEIKFGTQNFAIEFKDYVCRIGSWKEVKDY